MLHPIASVFDDFRAEAPADEQRYLALVADYRGVLDGLREKLEGQRTRGILLPKPAIPGAVTTLRTLREGLPALFRLDDERLGALSRDARARLTSRVERLVADEVVPACDALLAAFDADYVAAAPEAVGLSQYEGGVACYRALVRRHTSSDEAPERIHAIGLEQVADLAERMAEARGRLGFTGSEAEFHASLARKPELFARTPAEVEAKYMRHMAALEPKLGDWFSVLPATPYGVERLPPEAEAGMTYGAYWPAMLGEEKGRYLYNGSDLEHRSLIMAAPLIFHELAPGHHFHFSRQLDDGSLPDVRRYYGELHAFNEGWAEYAAELGWEMGLYEDPYDGYGRLAMQRFMAQRLVVDTGMNVLGWSLARARDYMRENTLEGDEQVASETLRYATDWPGQALAYRLGFLEMRRLRSYAEQELGERFDVRGFHECVLENGVLPFSVLDEHVRGWVARSAAAA